MDPSTVRQDAEPSRGGVTLKLEWIQTGSPKRSDNVVLRAGPGRATTLTRPNRMVEVTPSLDPNGSSTVDLELSTTRERGSPERLATRIHPGGGERVVVMGSSTKGGKAASERLRFANADPISPKRRTP